ncbi:MAG: amino acid ABC transporter substrate-binding protein [Chloroflexi bacterium]|jgi:ABC-type amino acid transport substrate-binding protein|nr:amino acid ABC transporter substrate-binding protein [Chloroflexota bacterium]
MRRYPTRNAALFHTLRRLVASLCCVFLFVQGVRYGRYHFFRPDPSWERVQARAVLVVGMDTSYYPFAVMQGERISGLDVDIALEIARRLGVRLQVAPMGVDGLYDALHTGVVDALISALPLDPFRLDTFLYVGAYLDGGYFLVSPKGLYQRMSDLEGKRIAAEYGSLGDEQARLWLRRLRSLRVQHYAEPSAALAAVAEGEADAALVDYLSARLWLREHREADLRIAEQPIHSEGYHVVLRIQDLALASKVSEALEAMRADGSLAAIIARWLGEDRR